MHHRSVSSHFKPTQMAGKMASRQEHTLLLQRTRVWFPAPKSDDSQLLTAPSRGGGFMPSDIYTHVHTHIHKVKDKSSLYSVLLRL